MLLVVFMRARLTFQYLAVPIAQGLSGGRGRGLALLFLMCVGLGVRWRSAREER